LLAISLELIAPLKATLPLPPPATVTPIILTEESACTSSASLPAPSVRMLRSTVASRVSATVLLVSAAPPATSLEKPKEPAPV
jgi:hypothetical protein